MSENKNYLEGYERPFYMDVKSRVEFRDKMLLYIYTKHFDQEYKTANQACEVYIKSDFGIEGTKEQHEERWPTLIGYFNEINMAFYYFEDKGYLDIQSNIVEFKKRKVKYRITAYGMEYIEKLLLNNTEL